MLLTRRGYRPVLKRGPEDLAELVTREHVDVVLIDASPSLGEAALQASKLQALCPRVAVVAVSDDPHARLGSLPVLLKWGAFGSLFEAIEHERSGREVRNGVH
jgi:hypothetical protein